MTDIYERLADENEPAPATAPAAQLTGDQASNLMASLTVEDSDATTILAALLDPFRPPTRTTKNTVYKPCDGTVHFPFPFHFSGHQMNTPGIPAHPSISTSGDKARLIPFTFNVRSGCPMAGHSAIRLP